MKIVNILTDGPTDLSTRIMDIQGKDNEVKVIDLTKKEASYDEIVDEMASADKVVSW
jgi:hypothetical protein